MSLSSRVDWSFFHNDKKFLIDDRLIMIRGGRLVLQASQASLVKSGLQAAQFSNWLRTLVATNGLISPTTGQYVAQKFGDRDLTARVLWQDAPSVPLLISGDLFKPHMQMHMHMRKSLRGVIESKRVQMCIHGVQSNTVIRVDEKRLGEGRGDRESCDLLAIVCVLMRPVR